MSSLLPPRLLALLVGMPPAQRREAVNKAVKRYEHTIENLDSDAWMKGQRDHLVKIILELLELAADA